MEEELRKIVGDRWVITNEDKLLYSFDGFTAVSGNPSMVVLPGSEEETVEVIRFLISRGKEFIVRGSGTSLSGATIPLGGEVVVSMTRLNKVYWAEGLEIEVGPGIANIMVTRSSPSDLFYAPDPSSYVVSSIGGNISHDSGGIHVIKYGPTFNSVISIKVILPNGRIEEFKPSPFFNPTSIFIGAEGTLGAILRARLRLFPKPKERKTVIGIFKDVESASQAVINMFKAGIIPSALEMMDKSSVGVVEKSRYKAGLPLANILLVELDGENVKEEFEKVVAVIKGLDGEYTVPEDDSKYWNARKGAFPAMGVVSPAYLTLDCNVPRKILPKIMGRIEEISKEKGVMIANVFHAGDGNLHPLIPYNPENKESLKKALEAGSEITLLAIEMGGVPSGEHGIGLEKVKFLEKYYSETDIEVMDRLRKTFDPKGLLNPCKSIIKDKCSPENEVVRWMWEWD
ncbi:FAD-linked oxidase C-terminal domain-containing protein [Acidianus sp. HS-5]|uniref:FAD-binding oxidoreductase n=1 Tax=Acidianus sp. HS-5 TaxID=2886040 RepID=UPI001F1B1A0D|nr:FAD-linked oxidase C-terminal domain-containing protein [Acidianus sp. HS-5]BDC18735.1 FAD-binding oxidoreductase [Acidianus sp. HS-5]